MLGGGLGGRLAVVGGGWGGELLGDARGVDLAGGEEDDTLRLKRFMIMALVVGSR